MSVDDYVEQIDWMCEQIKTLTERMDITIRRLDELLPDRINHHLRLLKLEEAKNERMDDRLAILEERVNFLYDKELSRALNESKLIEEIIRLEKLEKEFIDMVGFIKREGIDLRNIESNISKISGRQIAEVASEIAAQDIMQRVIRRLEGMTYDDY